MRRVKKQVTSVLDDDFLDDLLDDIIDDDDDWDDWDDDSDKLENCPEPPELSPTCECSKKKEIAIGVATVVLAIVSVVITILYRANTLKKSGN